MLRDHLSEFRLLLVTIDLALCASIFVIALPWGLGPVIPPTGAWLSIFAAGVIGCAAWPILLERRSLYTSYRREDLLVFATRMLAVGGFAALIFAAISFAFSLPLTRSFPLVVAGAQTLALTAVRGVAILALRALRRHGRNYRNIIIVGTGPRALMVDRGVRTHPEWGLRIVGFVDDKDTPVENQIPRSSVRKLVDLPVMLRDEVIDELVVAWPRSMFPQLEAVVASCASAGVPVTVISDFFGDTLPSPRVTRFDNRPALSFAPVHHSPVQLAVKRGIDIVGATLGLILISPVLAASAAAIRMTSPGPVFFYQERCGLNGRRFQMLKLRTMVNDAEDRLAGLAQFNEMQGPVFKMVNDPRITKVGRVLRRWSLDELPQLWNVLRGDMSLVGPRPPIPAEVLRYDPAQKRRLSMRPGLTCIWQVSGRNRIDNFGEWVRLDLEYIDGWSLAEDAKLMIRTIPAVLFRDGAS